MDQCRMNFAQTLKALRLKAGLTQEQLAHACGYSGQSRIGNYESGKPKARQPKPDELPTIAKALGVSVSALFGETALDSHSQYLILDPKIVVLAHRAVRDLLKEKKRRYDIEANPAPFVHMYQVHAKINTPQGAVADGRSDAVQNEGGSKKRTARVVQR